MKRKTEAPKTADHLIKEALADLQRNADAGASSALALTNLVLAHQTRLVSKVTILNEIATLLQHSVQDLERTQSSGDTGRPRNC